jgi:hypothetical protein
MDNIADHERDQLQEQQPAKPKPTFPFVGYGWSKQLATIFFIGLTAVFAASIFYHPAETAPTLNYSSICAFKNVTGLPCPGCGLTHSFCALGKGDVALAFGWHWLGPPLFLLLILVWLKAVFVLTNRHRLAMAFDRLAMRVRPAVLVAFAFAVYGIGRIIYILAYNPSVRGHAVLPTLFGFIGN